jgi:hypothetical protein
MVSLVHIVLGAYKVKLTERTAPGAGIIRVIKDRMPTPNDAKRAAVAAAVRTALTKVLGEGVASEQGGDNFQAARRVVPTFNDVQAALDDLCTSILEAVVVVDSRRGFRKVLARAVRGLLLGEFNKTDGRWSSEALAAIDRAGKDAEINYLALLPPKEVADMELPTPTDVLTAFRSLEFNQHQMAIADFKPTDMSKIAAMYTVLGWTYGGKLRITAMVHAGEEDDTPPDVVTVRKMVGSDAVMAQDRPASAHVQRLWGAYMAPLADEPLKALTSTALTASTAPATLFIATLSMAELCLHALRVCKTTVADDASVYHRAENPEINSKIVELVNGLPYSDEAPGTAPGYGTTYAPLALALSVRRSTASDKPTRTVAPVVNGETPLSVPKGLLLSARKNAAIQGEVQVDGRKVTVSKSIVPAATLTELPDSPDPRMLATNIMLPAALAWRKALQCIGMSLLEQVTRETVKVPGEKEAEPADSEYVAAMADDYATLAMEPRIKFTKAATERSAGVRLDTIGEKDKAGMVGLVHVVVAAEFRMWRFPDFTLAPLVIGKDYLGRVSALLAKHKSLK